MKGYHKLSSTSPHSQMCEHVSAHGVCVGGLLQGTLASNVRLPPQGHPPSPAIATGCGLHAQIMRIYTYTAQYVEGTVTCIYGLRESTRPTRVHKAVCSTAYTHGRRPHAPANVAAGQLGSRLSATNKDSKVSRYQIWWYLKGMWEGVRLIE